MNKQRKADFAKSFDTYQDAVEMACEAVNQELVKLGYEGKILEVAREIALFNVLGAMKGSTDIWATLLRSDLAYEIYRDFDSPGNSLNVFSNKGIKLIADAVIKEWNKSEIGDSDQIESDLNVNGLGHAQYDGIYRNWKKAGHLCPFEYCIKNFPPKEDSKTTCLKFNYECPGEIPTKDQNLNGECGASVPLLMPHQSQK